MLPQTELRLQLPRLHRSQATVTAGETRFNVVACGRRFGKTTLGIDRLLRVALEGAPTCWCVPSFRADDTEVKVANAVRPVLAHHDRQKHVLTLATGGRIDVHSLEDLETVDAIRGKAYKRAVIDEAAKVRHLGYAWEQVIRPTLTDYQGGAWFMSTPKSLNYFYRLFRLGRDPAYPDWSSWQFPTSANSSLPHLAEELDRARRELPERVFAQEYEARFLEHEGAVFRKVMQAVRDVGGPHPVDGHQYVIGADWAKHQDFTHYVVVDATARAAVAADRFQQIDYRLQLERLRTLARRYGATGIIAERNSMGDPLVEALAREGLPVQPFLTTQASKRGLVEALSLAFDRDEIALLDDPVLVDQLLAYTAERLPSGLLRYGAPEGQHDDGVMALMFAWQGAAFAGQEAFLRKAYGW